MQLFIAFSSFEPLRREETTVGTAAFLASCQGFKLRITEAEEKEALSVAWRNCAKATSLFRILGFFRSSNGCGWGSSATHQWWPSSAVLKFFAAGSYLDQWDERFCLWKTSRMEAPMVPEGRAVLSFNLWSGCKSIFDSWVSQNYNIVSPIWKGFIPFPLTVFPGLGQRATALPARNQLSSWTSRTCCGLRFRVLIQVRVGRDGRWPIPWRFRWLGAPLWPLGLSNKSMSYSKSHKDQHSDLRCLSSNACKNWRRTAARQISLTSELLCRPVVKSVQNFRQNFSASERMKPHHWKSLRRMRLTQFGRLARLGRKRISSARHDKRRKGGRNFGLLKSSDCCLANCLAVVSAFDQLVGCPLYFQKALWGAGRRLKIFWSQFRCKAKLHLANVAAWAFENQTIGYTYHILSSYHR